MHDYNSTATLRMRTGQTLSRHKVKGSASRLVELTPPFALVNAPVSVCWKNRAPRDGSPQRRMGESSTCSRRRRRRIPCRLAITLTCLKSPPGHSHTPTSLILRARPQVPVLPRQATAEIQVFAQEAKARAVLAGGHDESLAITVGLARSLALIKGQCARPRAHALDVGRAEARVTIRAGVGYP